MGRRSKYKTRPDGRKQTSRTYNDFGLAHFSGRKHFYGLTDDEIDEKIRLFERSLLEQSESKFTMSDLTDEWWEDKEPKLSLNTVQGYKTKKNEIIERFGDIPVRDMDTARILSWLNYIAGRGYSQHSINDRRSIIKNILDYALGKGIIETNPCAFLPAVKGNSKKKRQPASEEDIRKLEEHRADSLITRMFYFMEYSGCRIGECVVLQEKDIDRASHKASITKDIAFDGNVPVVKENPKTDAGIREVDLYDNVLEILPEYSDPETYIFFPDGLPHRSRLQRIQEKFRKDLGITSTAHQFRHTYAGIMHSAEINVKDTQARMGHANIAVTQDIYTEIERKHNEKVRNKANEYILEERLGRNKKRCPKCGSTYLKAEDGHEFSWCPDCGEKLK